MWLSPVLSAIVSLNVPSLSAVAVIDVSLSALRAMSVERAWTLPEMSTVLPLTFALSLGEVTVTFGFAVSRT